MAAKKTAKKTAKQSKSSKKPSKAEKAKKPTAKAGKAPAKRTATAGKKAKKVPYIPKGYHTLTASLIVRDGNAALAFYAKAFGAKQTLRMDGPGGSVMHAEMKIGDSYFMLGEESEDWGTRSPQSLGGSPAQLMIYCKDADALLARAVAAGAEMSMPVTPMFWGDKYGKVVDPFGHQWAIATHVEDVGPKALQKRAEAWMKEMASG